MATVAKQTETVKDVALGVQTHNTNSGEIVFINTDLVSQKTIDIMVAALNEIDEADGCGIYTVIFRADGYPRMDDGSKACWMFFPDSKAAVCNLIGCVENTFINTMDEDKENAIYCGVSTGVWKNLLGGFFHEMHHGHSFLTERDALEASDEAVAKEEEKADEFSKEHMIHMARTFDVEPDLGQHLSEMIGDEWTEMVKMINEDENASDYHKQWLMVQTHILEHDLAWFEPAPEDSDLEHNELKTFKELMHEISGDDVDDPAWVNDSATVPTTVILKQEPVTEAANGAPAAPVAPAVETPAVPAGNTQNLFVQPNENIVSTPGMQGVTQQPTVTAAVNQEYQGDPAAIAQNAPQAPVTPTQPAQQVVAPPAPQEQVVVGANVYPPVAMDDATFQATVSGLYVKIFRHIFQTCGYNAKMQPFFGQANKIVEALPLSNEEALIVKEMNTYNAQGQLNTGVPVQGYIHGKFMNQAQTLIGYELTLSTKDGQQIRRKFIPQNPHKQKNGQFTPPALEAQAGNQIMWIMDGAEGAKWSGVRMYNGVLQQQVNRQWTNVA